VNVFGLAMLLAGQHNTSWALMCPSDSDLDGQTNGDELGDPCCTWTFASGLPPQFNVSISNPGNFLSKTTRLPVNCTTAAPEGSRLRGSVAR